MNEFQKRIFVAGHRGMVGSAIVRCLAAKGYTNIITRSRADLDLTDQAQVRARCLWADSHDATGTLDTFFAPP